MSLHRSPTDILPRGTGVGWPTEGALPAALMWKLACAVLATALAAQIKIGAPVPVTLQTLAVTLVGFALGPRLAPAAMLLYVALGLAGLPFFAVGLLGPTGGYIMGFVPAAAIIGRFGHSGGGSWLRTTVVATAGTAVVFAAGLTWLTVWFNGNVSAALKTGLVPFLPSEMVKIALAVLAVSCWRSMRGRLECR